MFVTLHDGTEARIHVAHKTFQTRLGPRRGTLVKFVLDGRTFSVKAICNPTDNFSKKDGRKYAAEKLLDRMRSPETVSDWRLAVATNKQDRSKIFQALCPQFFPKKVVYVLPSDID